MDDAQLAEFCKRVAGNGPVVLAPLLSLRGDGETLQAELRKAKSASDIRRSIASFVDATGGKGMAWIRQIAGITDYDVKLENDENFTGALGRQQIEAQLAAHYDQVNAGKGNPEIIKQDLADMRARCAAMSDPKKYTDLPHEVRAHEVQRITRYIADLRYLSELAAPHK